MMFFFQLCISHHKNSNMPPNTYLLYTYSVQNKLVINRNVNVERWIMLAIDQYKIVWLCFCMAQDVRCGPPAKVNNNQVQT